MFVSYSCLVFHSYIRSACLRFSSIQVRAAVGVITPNEIPMTTIVTYLQKRYRSRSSNHWATIPACSVVPPSYKQSKKTYCHISIYRKFTVATVRFTQNISCNIYIHPIYQQMSLCNNSPDNKSYWIHRVVVKVSAQVATVTYMHQSQPSLHSLRIHFTVHLELWPGNHLIWCNATCNTLTTNTMVCTQWRI